MRRHGRKELHAWKKLLLLVADVVTVAMPVIIGVLDPPPLSAQSRPAAGAPLAFDVASVKQNKSGATPSRLNFETGGRFTARNIPLRTLILIAYRIQGFQLSGGPDWLNDPFDIVAKADGNPPVNELQLMLRTLFGERFKLTAHHETRELPIYALVMARSDGKVGAQLRRAGGDCAPINAPAGAPPPPPPPPASKALDGPGPVDADPNRVGQGCASMLLPGRMSGRMMTMTQVANTLARFLSRTVINRTGLTGDFDLDLEYTPDQMPLSGPGGPSFPATFVPSSDGPSIFTAVQEQLGLKLESTKGPVDVLVIDHIEQPTPD